MILIIITKYKMTSLKKVSFKEDTIIDNKDTKLSIKDNLVKSFKDIDIDENLYKDIFNQMNAFKNFHNNNIEHVDSDDEYNNKLLDKENDLYYESSEDEDLNDIDNYDNLESLDIDDMDRKQKYVLGFRECIIEKSNNNQIINNNDQIINNNDQMINNNDQIINNNDQKIDNKSNNIEDKDILDDILDKLDIDENKLDELIKEIKMEDNREIIKDKDEVLNEIDQEKKNNFDIEVSFNTFKKRYSEFCDKKQEPIVLKLFKILITNNPNKHLEFYVNFVKSFILNDK